MPLRTVRGPGCLPAGMYCSADSGELLAGLSWSSEQLLGEKSSRCIPLGFTAERAKVSGASEELHELQHSPNSQRWGA